MTAQEWISLLEARAPALRAAGVRHLEIDGNRVAVSFADPDPEPAQNQGTTARQELPTEADEVPNPLDDPATFGGQLPGYEFDEDDNE